MAVIGYIKYITTEGDGALNYQVKDGTVYVKAPGISGRDGSKIRKKGAVYPLEAV